MNLLEAIKLLDTPENEELGNTVIKSTILNKWLVNSKYGICQCTNDWPVPHVFQKEDFDVIDWEVSD